MHEGIILLNNVRHKLDLNNVNHKNMVIDLFLFYLQFLLQTYQFLGLYPYLFLVFYYYNAQDIHLIYLKIHYNQNLVLILSSHFLKYCKIQ